MKTTLQLMFGFIFVVMSSRAFAQSMDDFFRTKGVKDLCGAAHPNNDFIEGKYYVASDHVSISIVAEDFAENTIYTDIQLRRGNGDLPFTELVVTRDTDPFATFEAFKMQVQLTLLLYKGIVGEELFERTIGAIQLLSHKKVGDWDGATWALLAINFGYLSYTITGE